jgi:short-subunit dehydrogenase
MEKKIVLITGASAGIGEATAIRLGKAGYVVYASARRVEKMKHLEDHGIHVLNMDITKDSDMVSGIENILLEQGRIDVLINNAGYGSYGALEDVPISEARYQFDVNIFGMARLTQLVLPHMRARHSGRIINISSMGGRFGEPHGAWYHASKFAVEGLSDCLRMELKQFGIDVVVIQPGAIITEWNTISRENLLKVSGNTDYKDLAFKHFKMLEKGDGKMGSQPDVIARVIEKAIASNKPKTRYAAGSGAKLVLFVKSILSDTLFDKLILSQMK